MKSLAVATLAAVVIVATPIPGAMQVGLLGLELVVAVCILGALLHDAKDNVEYWRKQARTAADEANEMHGRNVAIDRDRLLLEAELHFAETGRGLSDAQAAAHEAHITHALHVVAAGGSVVQFPTQRKASE